MGRKKYVKKGYWDKKTMQEWCDSNAEGYTILGTDRVDKGYQNVLYAHVQCPNLAHRAYFVPFNRFKGLGNRCLSCHKESKGQEQWTVKKVFSFFLKNDLIILDPINWHSVDDKVSCVDQQGYKYKASITSLKSKSNPSKYKNNPYALENIQLYCILNRPDYMINSEEYTGIKALHEWRYTAMDLPPSEDITFTATVDNFIHGKLKHPYFSKRGSALEIKIRDFLEDYNIMYIAQKRFKSCKDKYTLPFDFYLPKYNLLIEAQGFQHYEAVDFFGGEEGFKDRQKKDKIKKDYAEKHYNFLEIPYWEFNNIEQILEKALKPLDKE